MNHTQFPTDPSIQILRNRSRELQPWHLDNSSLSKTTYLSPIYGLHSFVDSIIQQVYHTLSSQFDTLHS